jgi:hypothetical protein
MNNLLELAEWLYNYGNDERSDDWYQEQAAMLRKLAEQKPVGYFWRDDDGEWHEGGCESGAVAHYEGPVTVAEQKPVFLVCTGEVYEGQETYTRHEGSPPPMCDFERLYTAPVAFAEQKPVAWAQVVHDKVWRVFKYKGDAERYLEKVHVDAVVKPLVFAAPVPAIDVDEAMRLADEYMSKAESYPPKLEAARAALAAYLKGQR